MNPYLKNLNRIEFVVTMACTGECKHCSQGDHKNSDNIDKTLASDAVRKIAEEYYIDSVMTFGGEPLLCADTVCEIHKVATDMNIPKRQLITNGYFSRDYDKIRQTAVRLAESGINDILLSVDAFHQETIPLDVVKIFASEAKKCGIHIRLSPAWLVSVEDDNPYNRKTREILDSFGNLDIPIGAGNVVFPEGNAKKYLAEYFGENVPENPYVDDPYDIRCLSFSPNGDLLDGNAYREDLMEIIKKYAP